ncbi:MAG: glutamine amidotransferase [Pelagibacteraceae bacterium]|nr:glutamine amidotransferase [Pelagibacteraceae bacterium]|tara:strand:+ start:33165 stop:33863 length:699 start_codon:yes stop_codon:yes gene_type:complete
MKTALFILHQKTSEAGNIKKKLKKRGFNFEMIRPSLGEDLPNNLDKYQTIVVFGGPMSVNDDDEYMKKEIAWIGQVLKTNIPFLGICLGAQLIAKYLGCEVKKNVNNLSEIGFYNIQPTSKGLKMFESQKIFYQFHSEGFDLPSGCDLLAKGDIFYNQAFRYKNCYGLQFHPEVNIYLHLKWIILVLIKKPQILFKKGAQNFIYQLILRIKYNNSISKWLDDFLDNYLLKEL